MTQPAFTPEDVPLDVDDLQDKYKRALAELDNMRKRKAKDIEQARSQAEEMVAAAFLDIVDDFRRALEAITTAKGRNAKQQVLDGVNRLFEKFIHTLKTLEIEGFHAQGQQFTAELMEAIAQVPTRQLPPGMVAAEISQGFTRRGKLLRPAKVAVAVAGGEDDAPAE